MSADQPRSCIADLTGFDSNLETSTLRFLCSRLDAHAGGGSRGCVARSRAPGLNSVTWLLVLAGVRGRAVVLWVYVSVLGSPTPPSKGYEEIWLTSCAP